MCGAKRTKGRTSRTGGTLFSVMSLASRCFTAIVLTVCAAGNGKRLIDDCIHPSDDKYSYSVMVQSTMVGGVNLVVLDGTLNRRNVACRFFSLPGVSHNVLVVWWHSCKHVKQIHINMVTCHLDFFNDTIISIHCSPLYSRLNSFYYFTNCRASSRWAQHFCQLWKPHIWKLLLDTYRMVGHF